MQRIAAAREMSVEELRDYLVLAKLVPVIRDQVLGMTTVTANELVTEEKLRFVARERNHVEQRRMFERLLAGQHQLQRLAIRHRGRTPPCGRAIGTRIPGASSITSGISRHSASLTKSSRIHRRRSAKSRSRISR